MKIKFNIFNTLFHLFSFLADKTNGWGVFVKPKLLFGSLIMGVGVGISACSVEKKPEVMCYDPMPADTTTNVNEIPEEEIEEPEILCYAPALLIEEDSVNQREF